MSAEIRSLLGLVLWPLGVTDLRNRRELRQSMPVVIVDSPVKGFEADFVGFDDERAGYEAARHLYERGHRQIAFVGSRLIVTSRLREIGFRRFMDVSGLAPVLGYEPLDYGTRCLLASSTRTLSISWRTTAQSALLCENDQTAAKLIPYLTQRGLRVPDEVALMGFGGSQRVLVRAIGLTTMEQPFGDLGREAARLLLDRLEGRERARCERSCFR